MNAEDPASVAHAILTAEITHADSAARRILAELDRKDLEVVAQFLAGAAATYLQDRAVAEAGEDWNSCEAWIAQHLAECGLEIAAGDDD